MTNMLIMRLILLDWRPVDKFFTILESLNPQMTQQIMVFCHLFTINKQVDDYTRMLPVTCVYLQYIWLSNAVSRLLVQHAASYW